MNSFSNICSTEKNCKKISRSDFYSTTNKLIKSDLDIFLQFFSVEQILENEFILFVKSLKKFLFLFLYAIDLYYCFLIIIGIVKHQAVLILMSFNSSALFDLYYSNFSAFDLLMLFMIILLLI
jgi:hypothetical protein